MLNNLQLIPREAFTASEHIILKVIDKISNAVGWAVIPKGNKMYQLEAERYLVEQIKNNSDMPTLAKAACISDAKRILREYRSQHNVFLQSLKFINDSANPEKVDDDWLAYFFDNAKNISREEVAVIWGQILAQEMNVPNQIPKSLIYILSIIDYKDAVSFRKLASFSLKIGDMYFPIVFFGMTDAYRDNGLGEEDILNLAAANLVQYDSLMYHEAVEPKDKITYFDELIDIGDIKQICVGSVMLTKAGQALMSVISDKRKIDEFAEFVRTTIVKELGGVFDEM